MMVIAVALKRGSELATNFPVNRLIARQNATLPIITTESEKQT